MDKQRESERKSSGFFINALPMLEYQEEEASISFCCEWLSKTVLTP